MKNTSLEQKKKIMPTEEELEMEAAGYAEAEAMAEEQARGEWEAQQEADAEAEYNSQQGPDY